MHSSRMRIGNTLTNRISWCRGGGWGGVCPLPCIPLPCMPPWVCTHCHHTCLPPCMSPGMHSPPCMSPGTHPPPCTLPPCTPLGTHPLPCMPPRHTWPPPCTPSIMHPWVHTLRYACPPPCTPPCEHNHRHE